MMLRKFGRIDAPVELVKEHFLDLASWPEWMPTIKSARVLETSSDRLVAEFRQHSMGRVSTLQMEFLIRPSGYLERQLAGRLRRWDAEWKFSPPPEGSGTVVSMRLDVEVGGLGSLAPKRMVYRAIGRIFDQIIVNVQQRLSRRLAARDAERAAGGEAEELRVRIFTAGEEIEIEIGDRRFVAHATN